MYTVQRRQLVSMSVSLDPAVPPIRAINETKGLNADGSHRSVELGVGRRAYLTNGQMLEA